MFAAVLLTLCCVRAVWAWPGPPAPYRDFRGGYPYDSPSRYTTIPTVPFAGKELTWQGAVERIWRDDFRGRQMTVRMKDGDTKTFYLTRYVRYFPSFAALKEGSRVTVKSDSMLHARSVEVLFGTEPQRNCSNAFPVTTKEAASRGKR